MALDSRTSLALQTGQADPSPHMEWEVWPFRDVNAPKSGAVPTHCSLLTSVPTMFNRAAAMMRKRRHRWRRRPDSFMPVCAATTAASSYRQASTICQSRWHRCRWMWGTPLDSRAPVRFRQPSVDCSSDAHPSRKIYGFSALPTSEREYTMPNQGALGSALIPYSA